MELVVNIFAGVNMFEITCIILVRRHVTLMVITGTTKSVPTLLSSHCNSFEDWVPVDEIYGYPVFKWVAMTWQGWQGTRIVVPKMATRWQALLHIAVVSVLPCSWSLGLLLPVACPCVHNCNMWLLWSYSTVRKYSKPYLRTLGSDPRDTFPYVRISFDWAP